MNKKTNFLGTTTLLSKLYWLAAGLFFLYFQIFEAPRKGFNVSDMGYSMTAARDLTQGIIDISRGLAPVVNALLIKLGFNYLNITRFYYSLQFFSALLFVFSLRIRTKMYWLCPIAACLMLTPIWQHLVSYQSAGALFLLMAVSLLFIIQNYSLSNFSKSFFYGLSASLFTFSSVSCTLLTPSLFINAAILFFVYPKIRNKTFIITYCTTAFISLYIILTKMLPLILEIQGLQHWSKLITAPLTIILMVVAGYIFVKLLLSYFLIDPELRKNYQKNNKVHNIKTRVICLILATVAIWIVPRILQPANQFNFDSILNSMLLYALIYFGALMGIFGYKKLTSTQFSPLILALALQLQYYIAFVASDWMPWNYRSQLFGTITLIILVFLEQLFADNAIEKTQKLIISILLIVAAYFPIKTQFFYTYGGWVPKNIQKITGIPKLNGLYDQPNKISQLKRIIQIYKQNHCQNKLFISRRTILLPYYMFNKVGQMPMYWYATTDLNKIKNASSGYCYLTDGDFTTNLFHDKFCQITQSGKCNTIVNIKKINLNQPLFIKHGRIKNYNTLKNLRTITPWLQKNAKQVYDLGVDRLNNPGNNYHIKFYVK